MRHAISCPTARRESDGSPLYLCRAMMELAGVRVLAKGRACEDCQGGRNVPEGVKAGVRRVIKHCLRCPADSTLAPRDLVKNLRKLGGKEAVKDALLSAVESGAMSAADAMALARGVVLEGDVE